MKKISEINELEIGEEYYLEIDGFKLKAYITDIVEELDVISFSFPCLLSGEGYFKNVLLPNINYEIGSSEEPEMEKHYKQIRLMSVKQVYDISTSHKVDPSGFCLIHEALYANTENEDEIVDYFPEPMKIDIYEPTRDKLYEKFEQSSLSIILDKYTFPELSMYVKGLL